MSSSFPWLKSSRCTSIAARRRRASDHYRVDAHLPRKNTGGIAEVFADATDR
jgi:hypothetical protein